MGTALPYEFTTWVDWNIIVASKLMDCQAVVEMSKILWASLPLEDESIRMASLTNPNYEIALNKNITKKFFKRMRIVGISQQNFILSCFGTQGSGKSYMMLFLLERFNAFKGIPVDVKYCCFTINDLLDIVEGIKKGETFILDEQVHTSGYGSTIERRILENIEMTVRADRLSFFFLAPKFIHHNYHYFLETWQMGSTQPWDFEENIYDQWEYTRSILFDHRRHMLGYIVTAKPEDEDFLKKYERKKSKYIKAFRARRGSGRHKHILKRSYQLLTDDDFLARFMFCKTKRLKRLLVITSLEGELISIEELNMMIDYTDYLINFDDKIKKKALMLKARTELEKKAGKLL